MYLAKITRKDGNGEPYDYWMLRQKYWDKEERRSKDHYITSVGRRLTITESEARELAERVSAKLGEPVSVDDLRQIRRLQIVADDAETDNVTA